MMTKKSKQLQSRRHRIKLKLIAHKKHIAFLLIIIFGIFFLVELGLFLYGNYYDLIYPPLPRNTQSPKQLISQRLQLPIVEHGSRYQYKVALTFDADMTPNMQRLLKLGVAKSWYDGRIKQTLDSENVRATVFLSQLWVETYPNEAKALALDPLFEIGNQSYSRSAFSKNCTNSSDKISATQELIKKITGISPKYFRFTNDCFDMAGLKKINDLGLKVIYWDVASLDGFNENTNSIVQTVESKTQNGSIIVFHLNGGQLAPKTSEALVKIIPFLNKRGYQMVTMSELLNE